MNHFDKKIQEHTYYPLKATSLDTLQINIGLRCNHNCFHCHLNAAPDRTEQMNLPTINKILDILNHTQFTLIDITGGAPELHPHIHYLIEQISDRNQPIQLRTNLTALATNNLNRTISFLATNQVHIVASLPCYLKENVDSQRGSGVFEKSITTLQVLNTYGYGIDPTLPLTLMHNPLGPSIPPPQITLEDAYRKELKSRYDISFTNLHTITNMPIGRFKQHLQQIQQEKSYQELFTKSFNPATIDGLMCRHQISIAWDGTLYDCDFNIALHLPLPSKNGMTLDSFDTYLLSQRSIITGEHCFGCTAGHGSSCGGALIP
ncbi:MAG: arsenosugar biosynthesis radical SAM protein ArsS [Candidatus Thermoplasmatota archaeon]|nr:arsenosugar biosynthesis radical SAM protein ArsS [Candidatus Thermoplasmatota archaeon]MBU1941899.1 arsenosugar biosynthesis radical SAM protein ArsS [Candidatus Thermoplasmatota archaeon]